MQIGNVILISQPTDGNRIKQYENPRQALFVIDIQDDFTGSTAKPPFPNKDSEKLITTVNSVIEAAARKNIDIIFIRQEIDSFLVRISI